MTILIATEQFTYNCRTLAAGDEFEAEACDVAILTRSLHPRARVPEAKAQQTCDQDVQSEAAGDEQVGAAGQPQRRGRYNRRDVRAAD